MGIVNQYDALSIWYAFWLSTARAIHAVSLLHGLFGFISLSLCVLYLFVLGRRTAQPLDVAAPHATTVCHVTHAVFVRRLRVVFCDISGFRITAFFLHTDSCSVFAARRSRVAKSSFLI